MVIRLIPYAIFLCSSLYAMDREINIDQLRQRNHRVSKFQIGAHRFFYGFTQVVLKKYGQGEGYAPLIPGCPRTTVPVYTILSPKPIPKHLI